MSKKLNKIQIPPKPKLHWDYVVEEMNWLSGVIAQERKTKKLTCHKCAKMIKKHFADKDSKDSYFNIMCCFLIHLTH